jgi:hypothetical protein
VGGCAGGTGFGGAGSSVAPPAGAVVCTAVVAPEDTGEVIGVVSSLMGHTMTRNPAHRLDTTWEFPERDGYPDPAQATSSQLPGSVGMLPG